MGDRLTEKDFDMYMEVTTLRSYQLETIENLLGIDQIEKLKSKMVVKEIGSMVDDMVNI